MRRPNSTSSWQFKDEINNLMKWAMPVRTHETRHIYNVSRKLLLVYGMSELFYGYRGCSWWAPKHMCWATELGTKDLILLCNLPQHYIPFQTSLRAMKIPFLVMPTP
eukprot:3060753-Ditylum_brightwellii.AAC.1